MIGARAEQAQHSPHISRRVLVVDASREIQQLVRQVLATGGFEIAFEEDSNLIDERLSRHASFDVVVIDASASGKGVLRRLSAIKKTSPRTEVIVISRLEDMDHFLEAIRLGAYEYLPKPLPNGELRRVVVGALENRRAS